MSESTESRGRGRPPFVVTEELRERVAVAAGGGMSHEEIALAIGCCRQTLENHFAHELSLGAYERRLAVLQAFYEAAVKGNVAAGKAYLQHAPALAAPPDAAGADQPPPERLPDGKKARAEAEAKTAQAGTKWDGVLPPPVSTPKLSLVK